jgi:hypothetical protein
MHLSTISRMIWNMLPIPLNITFRPCLTLCSLVSSQDASKYTLSTFPNTPPSTFSSTLPSMLWRILLLAHNGTHPASATTLVSVRNNRVFRTTLTALTEPRTICGSCTCFLSPRRRVRIYWTDVVGFRSTWEHLEVEWITVEQSGKNIFFGNDAGAPENHGYHLSCNDFQNVWIQFIYSSILQYSDQSTHGICGMAARRNCEQFKVCLKMTLEWTQRYTTRPWSSEFGDSHGGRDWASLEMYWKAVIEQVWRCTLRPWSSESGNALGDWDWLNWELHMEAGIERDWRCNWKPRDGVNSEMYLEAEIERVWRCT